MLHNTFLVHLARNGGERALRKYLTHQGYRTDSPEMEAHNWSILNTLESNEWKAASALEKLAALSPGGYLAPVSRKSHHNAMAYTPAYAEAYGATEREVKELLLSLDARLIGALNPELQRQYYHYRTLERFPSPSVINVPIEGLPEWSVALVRRYDTDQWFVSIYLGLQPDLTDDGEMKYESGQAVPTSPIWLRTGHLSPRSLKLEASCQKDVLGTRIIVVTVDHADACYRGYGCQLPAAMEWVERIRWWEPSAWRINANIYEARMPQVGTRVRLGDVLFGRTTSPTCAEESRHIPYFLARVSYPSGAYQRYDQQTETAYFYHPELMIVSHPDHYTVRIDAQEGHDWIWARPVAGKTQYVPPRYTRD